MPAISVPSTPPASIEFPSFISGFVGTSYLRPLPPYPKTIASPNQLISLSPSTYSEFFLDLLSKELAARSTAMSSYGLYNVPVYQQDISNSLYKVTVHGIRELCPPLKIGDIVQLRQIRMGSAQHQYPPQGFTGMLRIFSDKQ